MRRSYSLTLTFFAVFFAALGGVAIPAHANAGVTLYLNPSGGTFEVGSTFTVSISLNTGGQAINAVEAGLRFPPDKLQIVSSAPNEQSIMRLWIKPPTYSNSEGTIHLQGVIPNPGIDTSAGLVSVLTFRVKEAGVAEVKFTDDSRVFLNDGQATDILTKTTGGIYAFSVPPPQGPFVVSRTNPDQGRWYRSEFVQFEWSPPLDIEGYSYALDDDFDSSPDDVSEGTSTRSVYNNLADGAYYFHIRAVRQGGWW